MASAMELPSAKSLLRLRLTLLIGASSTHTYTSCNWLSSRSTESFFKKSNSFANDRWILERLARLDSTDEASASALGVCVLVL